VARAEQAAHRMREDIDAEVVGALLVSVAMGTFSAVEAGLASDLERVGAALIQLLRKP
jgi:hypothetical protein